MADEITWMEAESESTDRVTYTKIFLVRVLSMTEPWDQQGDAVYGPEIAILTSPPGLDGEGEGHLPWDRNVSPSGPTRVKALVRPTASSDFLRLGQLDRLPRIWRRRESRFPED